MPATASQTREDGYTSNEASGRRSAGAGTTSRPRASSGVCVRPQVPNSRLRSRSLLKAADTAGKDSSSSTAGVTPTSSHDASSDLPAGSPRFGATLLPRLAAVFGGSGGAQSGTNDGQNSSSSTGRSSYSYDSSLPASESQSFSASANRFSPDRAAQSDSGSSMLTSGENTASSSATPSALTSVGDVGSSTKTGPVKKPKGAGSPIASLPFLPRRRTLSNLFSQIASSGKDKEASPSTSNSSGKRDPASVSPTYNSLQLFKKESAVPAQSNTARHSLASHMHVSPHGWSTCTLAISTPPASSSSYSNPFASAFSYGGESSSATSSNTQPRPASPRLKKKDSYLALNIPPTPGGAFTPSLIYTENGNRPLRGQDEDLVLPSPITEADEPEHATQSRCRHQWHSTAAGDPSEHASSPSPLSASYSNMAAQPISSSTSFLSSLTSDAPTLSTQRAGHQTLSKLLPPILFLCISFAVSLTIMFYMVSTIPLKIPHNISEIKVQTVALRDYSRKGMSEGLHVSAVLSALFVFKQAFSVPGSILVNILFGSLYGTYAATLCACLFTGVGSVLAYYMARLCSPLVERFFPRALATTRSALLSGSSSDLFSYLLLARLFPLLPYSALNIACGVLKVPVSPYFMTLVLGSFPYNFVTTQLGDLLGELANSAEAGNINAIWTWDLIFKLAVASILSAAPVIFKEQLKGLIGGSDDQASKPDSAVHSHPRETTEAESIPLSSFTSDVTESSHPYTVGLFGQIEQDSSAAPLLRRDRTDSSASEVLFAPALHLPERRLSGARDHGKHQKQWSFSWKNLRRSLNNESACSDYSVASAGSSSFATHSTGRTSFDEEVGDTDGESARDQATFCDLQRRSSGSSYYSFASRNSQAPHIINTNGNHSRPSSIDFSLSKYGRRTASVESVTSSPTVAQHHQFTFAQPVTQDTGRLSQEWDRF